MKAKQLFYQRIGYEDGLIVEISIWRIPTPLRPSSHGMKYSLFYDRPRIRQVGYDNELGKGDHKHLLDIEHPYVFTTAEQLSADFWIDVKEASGKH